MKKNYTKLLAFLLLMTVFFSSCTKNAVTDPSANSQDLTNKVVRNYGLQAMTPDQWSSVPAFNSLVVTGRYRPSGLSYSGTLPTNHLLTTPAVRDQGQIGSCTGFCGSETEEILNYYNANPSTPSPAITVANGISTALNTQFSSPATLFGINGALSPLFLYYVERVVIQKQLISADNGANMVNIGQALQGTTSNTTSTALTYGGVTFKGECTEDLYAYPFVSGTGGYNVATSTSASYLKAPSSAAISNALSYTLGAQSGTTNNAGTTSHGYYVISSTGASLLNDVKTALANNKPVMMGFNVYDNTRTYSYFEGLSTTKYTYNPLTTSGSLASGVRLLGGHAVPLVGYIDDATQSGGGVFVVENSWGTPWGNHGFFYLPYSVIQSTKVVPAGSLYVAVL